MKLSEILNEPQRFYNVGDWKKTAKAKGYKITGPASIGNGAKMYYAYDPKNTKDGEIAGQMIDWGKGYHEGNL